MPRVVVYPYSFQFAPFLRQMQYDHKYDVVSVVMPGTWYENGQDASYVDEGERIGVPIYNDFWDEIEKCTTIIWADYDYEDNYSLFDHVIEDIIGAMGRHKNILCCQPLEREILTTFETIAKKQNVNFEYLVTHEKGKTDIKSDQKITIPIITVMGMGENCSKFEVQLLIRRILRAEGYKVSQIGSRTGCELLDFHSFPQFMFSKEYTETEKINCFLNFVLDVQNKEQADVMIIGVPGGILPLNNSNNLYFGITAFEVFNTIRSDFNILNLWCEKYNSQFIRQMENVVNYRFNSILDCVFLSNIHINSDSKGKSLLEYDVFDRDTMTNYIGEISNKPVYSVLDFSSYDIFKKQLLSQLSRD